MCSRKELYKSSLKELNSTQTLVTWTMTGKKGFFAKAVGLFRDCSEMVGAKFDESLGNLRKVVESKGAVVASEEVKS